jgi:HK97 family phage major capsid protein
MTVEELRTAYQAAFTRMQEADQAIEDADDDAEHEGLQSAFDEAEQEAQRAKRLLERAEARAQARRDHPALVTQTTTTTTRGEIRVGAEPHTYRPDTRFSYFGDLYRRTFQGDRSAAERLERHGREMQVERRDITSDDATGTAEFLPPIYLGQLWAAKERAGRPFANALGAQPLPTSTGVTITLPKLTTGTATAVQANDLDSVQETDAVSSTITTPMVTIAGQQDMSRQLLERSDPGMDMVIFSDLMGAYDTSLDTQLLSGSGTGKTHAGITSVASTNSVAYTDSTPTAAELVPKIYDAIQKIASNRFRAATHIVMHPRRAAWLASNLSSTFPLFQQGGFFQALGAQSGGSVMNMAGLPIVQDANMETNVGASTDQDEIFVICAPDLFLFEGPIRTAIHEQVLSSTLAIRLQVFAYSFFISERYPTGISVVAGTGLVTPTF